MESGAKHCSILAIELSGTTPPSSWQGKTTNRWGLTYTGISGGGNGKLDIAKMALYRLGDDASSTTST